MVPFLGHPVVCSFEKCVSQASSVTMPILGLGLYAYVLDYRVVHFQISIFIINFLSRW